MIDEVSSSRYDYYMSDYPYGYSSYNSSGESSFTMGIISLLFFFYFITVDIAGIAKIKLTTTKVLSIIGLSLSGIFLLWNFAMMAEPNSISFDEIGPAWILYSLVMLAFMIVGLVQSIRYLRVKQSGHSVQGQEAKSDLLDS